MKRLLFACALLCAAAFPAWAQKTPTAIQGEINSAIVENDSGNITAAVLNGILNDIAISYIPLGANTVPFASLPAIGAGTLLCNAGVASAVPAACWSGVSNNVEATSMPGIDNGTFMVYSAPTGLGSTPAGSVIRGQRNITSGVGMAGNTYKALWGFTNAFSPTEIAYEWAVTGELHNQSPAATGAQNVGVNGTIFKETPTAASIIHATTGASGTGSTATVTFAGGATVTVGHSVTIAGVTPSGYNGTYKVTGSSAGSVSFASSTTGSQTVAGTLVDTSIGPSWGGNFVCVDNTNEPSPIASCIGAELDVYANSATTDTNRQRVMLQLGAAGTSGAHLGAGILLTTGTGVTVDTLLYAPTGTAITDGINLSAATITGNAWASPGFTVDATGNATAKSLQVSANVPAASSCGTTPAVAAGSNNNGGKVTLGTGSPTTCTLTFATAFPTTATCTVSPASAYTGTWYISSQSRSAFTVTLGTGTSGAVFQYSCIGN